MPKYAKAIMITTLKTKRLALRPLSISNLDAMINIIMSDRDVMYWLPRSEDVTTLEGQQEVASGYITHFTKPWEEVGFGVWAVCIRGTEPEILETFSIIFRKSTKSPFDVPGIKTKATTKDILEAVRESRERFAEQGVED